MKDLLILLMLLNSQTAEVCLLPYHANSNEQCNNPDTEYVPSGSELCCRRCPPGKRLKEPCSETADTECEQCQPGQYMEGWNYSPNCFSCPRCKIHKGLQNEQTCTSTMRSTCVCLPERYCIMGFADPYCEECRKYTQCKAGHGVSVPGGANSNVRCAQCPHGTFSSTSSSTESCRPHSDCGGRAVVRQGNTTSDTVCEPPATILRPSVPSATSPGSVYEARSSLTSTASVNSSFLLSVNSAISVATLEDLTKTQPPIIETNLVAVVTSVACLILILAVILMVVCPTVRRRDEELKTPKTDANGNCDSSDKVDPTYLTDTQLTSFTVTSPEQHCLLETRNTCSNPRNNSENLIRAGIRSSLGLESIGPLQSTIALHDPDTALSEPMPLRSINEPVSPQSIIPPQSSSQPTTPQLISPVASNPHFDVKITFNIGNGAYGTPAVLCKDDSLPLSMEEGCFSVPQQEDGKQSLVAVQESDGLKQ
ncbi:tumor necrosis factor receptor superfamily member 1B [Genypterus blacodes]|uniref:tumor necrosis factor receptor superfamily member 1B n=1 Tax=Genypterus blacodes TaxID=154954 RepID=UPI003F761956